MRWIAIATALLFVGCDGCKEGITGEPAPPKSGAVAPAAPVSPPEAPVTPPAAADEAPSAVRMLIGGADAARIAAFLGKTRGPNAGCDGEGDALTCGQVVLPDSSTRSLSAPPQERERLVRAEEVIIEPETNKKKAMLRVRVKGDAARTIMLMLDAEMAARPGGTIGHKNHECFHTSEDEYFCGFILEKSGVTYILEHFGYH
jgi:hypothetical protein